jgi:Zn ribbon nucleic-acid-binding protein
MCHRCQKRFARLLGWVVMDWVQLYTNLPTPAHRGQQERRTTQKVFGHPAEWASDTLADIAAVLNATHDGLAEHLGQSPAPTSMSEAVRIRRAWEFLECRIPQLALYSGGQDAAIEIHDLHGSIRSRLGLTRPRQILPTPCPACELRGVLFRSIDVQHDSIECGGCGHVIREEHYPFYTRMVLEEAAA